MHEMGIAYSVLDAVRHESGLRHGARVTKVGVRIGVLLVKARSRLLGPILAKPALSSKRSANPSKVEAALRGVDKALDALCHRLGLRLAA